MYANTNCFNTDAKLKRMSWLSNENPEQLFSHIMHHFNAESLVQCFNELDGRKAVGLDGVTKEEYGKNLDENIKDLLERMKRMGYRPGDIREVMIPKDDDPSKSRPLGISNFEDKIVQNMTHKVLEAIYEPLFKECSYAFRPKRGCHKAIKDLMQYLYKNEVKVVLEIDLADFFGSIDHEIMQCILSEKIGDFKFIRYILRMFKSKIINKDGRRRSPKGIVQGNLVSPILSNIYAHYVIDLWFEEVVTKYMKGKVKLFRYCDDIRIVCELEEDAKRIMDVFPKRLSKYALILNEDKTKVSPFSKKLLVKKRGCFNFLGFTFYLGKSHRGYIIPKLKTNGRRLKKSLKTVNVWFKKVRNRYKLRDIWSSFRSKVQGHIQYFGVSFNSKGIQKFLYMCTKIAFKWLNRRSQKKSFNWDKFNLFLKLHPLPKAKIYHKLF